MAVTEAKANLYDAAAAWNCAMTSEQDKEAGEAFKAAMDALIAAVCADATCANCEAHGLTGQILHSEVSAVFPRENQS